MVKAVIFDMDGLMFDTKPAYYFAHQKMFERRGFTYSEELWQSYYGKKTINIMGILAELFNTGETAEELLLEQDEILREEFHKTVEKMPGLDEVIRYIDRHNIKKALCTNARRKTVDLLLKRFGFENEFEIIITGDMVLHGKPAPDIYLLCLEKLKLGKEDCLVLEDSLSGVIAAKEAGCKVCAVISEGSDEKKFEIADCIGNRLDDEFVLGAISN